MTFLNTRLIRAAALIVIMASCLAATRVKAQEIPYEVKVNYSLAAENFKNGDYVSALPYLRWLLENAPTLYNGERIHKRAVKTYEALAGATDDADLKVAYLDSALYLLDNTVARLQDADAEIDVGQWEVDFGNFLIAHRNEMPGLDQEAVDHFVKSYELNPPETDPYYVRLITQEYARLDMRDEAVKFMDEAEQHFQGNEELLTFFDEVRNQLFKSPEERFEFLKTQLAKSPDDVGIVRELLNIARTMGYTGDVDSLGNRLLELDPTTSTYRQMAATKKGNGNYAASLSLNRKALELTDDPEIKRDIEYEMAVTYYDTEDLDSARTHARRALTHDGKFGNAYVLIGDVLAKAVQQSAFEREDKAVYWLALDYYERARSVDPSVSKEAKSRVDRYRQYVPTPEEKFFKGWKEGDEYAIDYGRYAWIDETTKVR